MSEKLVFNTNTTGTYGYTVDTCGHLPNWVTDYISNESKRRLSDTLNEIKKAVCEGDTDGDKDILSASLTPSRIHFNGPVTVVIWEDGSKTVVRRAKDIPDDPYTAFCAALAKKVYGNNTRVKKILHDKTYVPKKKKKDENLQIPPLDWDGYSTIREEK